MLVCGGSGGVAMFLPPLMCRYGKLFPTFGTRRPQTSIIPSSRRLALFGDLAIIDSSTIMCSEYIMSPSDFRGGDCAISDSRFKRRCAPGLMHRHYKSIALQQKNRAGRETMMSAN
jgi:hypothetical protein